MNSLVGHTVGLPALIVMMTISQNNSPPQVRNIKITFGQVEEEGLEGGGTYRKDQTIRKRENM